VFNKVSRLVSLVVMALVPIAARAQQQPIRVNCGGPSYTDANKQLWQADTGYNTGETANMAAVITGTPNQALYQTQRFNADASIPLLYTFKVPNGAYHVNLYFAETWSPAMVTGARIFNVKLQGNPTFTALDVFAEAGANAPLIKGSDITVTNGAVAIEFDNVVQNPEINAIEILPGSSGPQLSLNFKYPDGTVVAGTLNYTISSTLLSFQGSEPLVNGQVTCALFANPSTIGISTQFTITATLTDSAGHVLWDLNIGMNPSQVNLATVQNSALSVVVQKL